MIYNIENEYLSVSIESKGAEISSIFHKQYQLEYLWQADPNVWARHAPILFPIVGQVQNGTYSYQDEQYHLSQHGFARDREFELVDQSANHITFRLMHDEDSLAVYPFRFELTVQYLLDRSRLISNYKVRNLDDDEMYFSLGLHPGFSCPLEPDLSFSDYYLEFDQIESSDRLTLDGSLLSSISDENYINNSQKVVLNHSQFDNDALIFEGLKSSSVTLKSDRSSRFVKVGIEGFPYLGIWSKPKTKAPYVCIEPWYGVTDEKDTAKSFDQKKGIQQLTGNSEFECNSYIEVG